MLTVVEWEKLNPTPLSSGVVEIFAAENPVLALLPFIGIAGNAYTYNQEAALPGIAFRGFNEGYTESTGVVNPATEKLTIVGGDSDFDVAQIAMGVGGNDTRAIHDSLKAKALTLEWLRTFFAGDTAVNSKAFDGLVKRLTGNQVLSAGTNGADLSLSMLDELADAITGQPSAIFMPKALIRQYRGLLRAAGGTTPESIMVPNFGRPVIAHNGVPLLPIEEDTLGNDILKFDETQGTDETTTSLYAVKFGADALHGIQTAPVSVRDLGEIDAKPALRTRIEWYSGIVLKHPRCAARLKGVKKPA
jgi:hypothetical protein